MNLHWRTKPTEEDSVKTLKRRIAEAKARRERQTDAERPLTAWDEMAIASRLTRRK